MSEKYIYRDVTEEDIYQLYSSKDANQWLIPHYHLGGTYSVRPNSDSVALPKSSKEWKLFRFLADFDVNDITDWFVYLAESGAMLITQDRIPLSDEENPVNPDREQEFVILYCSKELENDIQQICEKIVDIATEGGHYLTGDFELDYWEDPIISYRMAETNDFGRYN